MATDFGEGSGCESRIHPASSPSSGWSIGVISTQLKPASVPKITTINSLCTHAVTMFLPAPYDVVWSFAIASSQSAIEHSVHVNVTTPSVSTDLSHVEALCSSLAIFLRRPAHQYPRQPKHRGAEHADGTQEPHMQGTFSTLQVSNKRNFSISIFPCSVKHVTGYSFCMLLQTGDSEVFSGHAKLVSQERFFNERPAPSGGILAEKGTFTIID